MQNVTALVNRLRPYVAARLRCPAAVEDVLQETAIDCWKAGTEDMAAIWTVAKRTLSNFRRDTGRRESRVASHCDSTIMDLSPAEESPDTPDVEPLLQLAGDYRADVELWMQGGCETALQRVRAQRGRDKIAKSVTPEGAAQSYAPTVLPVRASRTGRGRKTRRPATWSTVEREAIAREESGQ